MYDIGVDNNKDNDDEYHVNDDVWIIILPGALFCDDYDYDKTQLITQLNFIIFGCQHTKKKKDIYSIDYDISIIIMTTNGFVGVYYLND